MVGPTGGGGHQAWVTVELRVRAGFTELRKFIFPIIKAQIQSKPLKIRFFPKQFQPRKGG